MTAYCFLETPVGRMVLASQHGALKLARVLGAKPFVPKKHWVEAAAPLEPAVKQLNAYFAGCLKRFSLSVKPEGTAFQMLVWAELLRIPYGARITYADLARRIGRPNAARAVGAANGANPVAIVIPCHRVIGASGALTGYEGGLEVKRQLLELESGQQPLL